LLVITSNRVYLLRDENGNVLKTLYRRERLKPITGDDYEDDLPFEESLS
jgi:hypothetical protein